MEKQRRLEFLLPLKGVFAVVIVMHHYLGQIPTEYHGIIGLIADVGYLPVEFYYFSSGILFVVAYYKKIGEGAYSLGTFLRRRLKKIYPPYLLTLFVASALIVLGNIFTDMDNSISVMKFVYNLFLLQGGILSYICPINGVTWFLTPLIFCNIIAFFISRIDKKEYAVLVVVILCMIGIITLDSEWLFPVFNMSMARGFVGFFCGMLFCFNLDRIEKVAMRKWSGVAAWFLIGLYLIEMKARTDATSRLILNTDLIATPALFLLIYRYRWLKKIICNRIFEFLGKISYSVYLWHYPVLVMFLLVQGLAHSNIKFDCWKIIILYTGIVFGVSCVNTSFFKRKEKDNMTAMGEK